MTLPPDSQHDSQNDPQFLSGSRQTSIAALRERIEEEFLAATPKDMIREAPDEAARREMIREVADYVFAVDSISLSRTDRLLLLDQIHDDLFLLGPLAASIKDEAVSEAAVDGPERLYVRRGAGDMTLLSATFDGAYHLERVMQCALAAAGIELGEPFIEVGTTIAGRPARLTVAAPPVSPQMHVEIRLHPAQPQTWQALIGLSMVDESAAALLQAIIAAGHGLMIVGDVGSGKTTLLETLLQSVQPSVAGISVERAAELRLPVSIESMTESASSSFGERIDAALDLFANGTRSGWLILDEVRFDEGQALWHALTSDAKPRCLWAFRGTVNPLRLKTAFSMALQRAQPGIAQQTIHDLLNERLPFVALLGRRDGQLKLVSVGEWQHTASETPPSADSDVLTLHPLWPESTGRAQHVIDWPRP